MLQPTILCAVVRLLVPQMHELAIGNGAQGLTVALSTYQPGSHALASQSFGL
jgi:hypothetical protein